MAGRLTPEQQNQVSGLAHYAKAIAIKYHPGDDEYISEAYLGLCKAAETFQARNGCSLSAYSHGVIVRHLIDFDRGKNCPSRGGGVAPSNDLSGIEGATGPDDESVLLECLPEDLYPIAKARWVDKASLKGLAKHFDLPPRCVSSKLDRAKRLIEAALKDD